MWQTIIGALPAAVAAPISAVLVTLDAHLLFVVLWAVATLAVGAIVRSALAKRDARYATRVRLVVRGTKAPVNKRAA
jgi:hypothetical protein